MEEGRALNLSVWLDDISPVRWLVRYVYIRQFNF